ncbi:hypothetical protein [Aureliella helgolandensis]|uniref:Outer membrane protein beta-barrel domain-containing protein n=1 Tax=Aureliella helgolandensis TaxID=2527968 RepID=A0A518G8F9_9BACT|nr:hypothetical protein [Aureliella helgolandensis]QDV24863.1 hypothetical protein Q31a_31850 [Aureliella helgolandensis]
MLSTQRIVILLLSGWLLIAAEPSTLAQTASGLRPINGGQPQMVPINPATQAGVYPSTGFGSSTFDPYASAAPTATAQVYTPSYNPSYNVAPTATQLPPSYSANPYSASPAGNVGGYPGYNGAPAPFPGTGQSATIGSFSGGGSPYSQPGVYPNSSPSALFPSSPYNSASGYGYGTPGYGVYPPPPGGTIGGAPSNWNPQGTIFSSPTGSPDFQRLFQGSRFRHTWLSGGDSTDDLSINDTDLAIAMLWPNFLFSNQPLYIMPSFSLHQWSGPKPPATADLPALAYSAFLDTGWQSDVQRIVGAELGLRVGMFTDFNTATSESLRIQGRAIGRLRITPKATLKLGVLYLDRNKTKLLPAGGLLWQPNAETRFDIFFPEPKLAHYLSTIGTVDSWWYVAGHYGGGAWTVERTSGATDSIDINDIRLALGFEWGRNDQMREGRRTGFFEVGYVFDRELIYKYSPADSLDLNSTLMLRAGIGY